MLITVLDHGAYDTPPRVFDKRIMGTRRRLGLNQKGLARMFDVDPGTLSRWESGKSSPSTNLLRRLTTILTSHLSDEQPIGSPE